MSRYELKVDLNVLNHLGLNLYSNVPAVLSELIANTWDADATTVNISISPDKIIIRDNGCGMTPDEINEKFLNVGYQRRKNNESDDLTQKHGRKVMGRKGIGKLSIFSIADHIQIFTKKERFETGIELIVIDIRNAIEKKESYYPKEIASSEIEKIEHDAGTTIILKNIKKRVQSSIDENLKKRIARRFNIWGNNFKVLVNEEKVTIKDSGYFDNLEFVTKYGNDDNYNFDSVDSDKIKNKKNIIGENNNYEVKGWIGLVKKSGDLQEGKNHENLNKISITVRGKVAMENILENFREGGLYTKFIIGEIQADFLDQTDAEDIATSNRQDLVQSDDRFIALKKFIGKELRYISKERVRYKEDEGEKNAREIPELNNWFDSLQGDTKKSAKKIIWSN